MTDLIVVYTPIESNIKNKSIRYLLGLIRTFIGIDLVVIC